MTSLMATHNFFHNCLTKQHSSAPILDTFSSHHEIVSVAPKGFVVGSMIFNIIIEDDCN